MIINTIRTFLNCIFIIQKSVSKWDYKLFDLLKRIILSKSRQQQFSPFINQTIHDCLVVLRQSSQKGCDNVLFVREVQSSRSTRNVKLDWKTKQKQKKKEICLFVYDGKKLQDWSSSVTLAILIIFLAISMSPWWFCPISAIIKHGWSPPTTRPGHSSNSNGISTKKKENTTT